MMLFLLIFSLGIILSIFILSVFVAVKIGALPELFEWVKFLFYFKRIKPYSHPLSNGMFRYGKRIVFLNHSDETCTLFDESLNQKTFWVEMRKDMYVKVVTHLKSVYIDYDRV